MVEGMVGDLLTVLICVFVGMVVMVVVGVD